MRKPLKGTHRVLLTKGNITVLRTLARENRITDPEFVKTLNKAIRIIRRDGQVYLYA